MPEGEHAMQEIINRIMLLIHGETAQSSYGFTTDASEVGFEMELILYKIILSKKTLGFEKG